LGEREKKKKKKNKGKKEKEGKKGGGGDKKREMLGKRKGGCKCRNISTIRKKTSRHSLVTLKCSFISFKLFVHKNKH